MLFDDTVIDGVYRIIEEIGSGGMGVVYLAYHLRLEKYVVLKQVKNPYADISMLRNEVDILKSLHHPYLPQVYDFVDCEGYIYTVIDYIDGYDLNYYINNGFQFSESQLIKWLRQLCEVLEYLHSRTPQILHTDIKPGNIIVTTSGDICLIDFGISVHNTDMLKGQSVNYSSPEQYGNFYYLQNGVGTYVQLDARTDIYSLGATLYHIMTGVRPDIRDFGQAAISDFSLPYSDAFVSIIEKSMQRDRNKRFRSAGSMLKAIDNIKKQDIRYKKYLLIQIAASVVSAVIVISGVFLIVSGYQQKIKTDFTRDYSEFVRLTDSGRSADAASLGMALLNNDAYDSVAGKAQKAQISHKIGDCFFDGKDYYNAAHYYRQAAAFEPNELYSRDLIISLILDGREDEAKKEMEAVKAIYPSSYVIIIAEAQLRYEQGEYSNAIETVDSNLALFNNDSENRYSLLLIKGDSLTALGRYDEAVSEYRAARELKETAAVIRKQGEAYMMAAMKSGARTGSRDAFNCYETLRLRYSLNLDDAINYAQCALSLEEKNVYEVCKNTLNDLALIYNDCRLYILLSELADVTEDPRAAVYCENAHTLYINLSDEEKMYISPDSLSAVQRLYREYCGREW